MTQPAEKRAEPTPGPWTFRCALTPSDGGYDYGIIAKRGEKSYCIAEVIEVVDYGLHLNAEANARLIAAAPDTAAERDRLKAVNEELRTVLVECEEYFDQRADADHNGVSFIANDEMRLLTEIRDILVKHGDQS